VARRSLSFRHYILEKSSFRQRESAPAPEWLADLIFSLPPPGP
jgi:hypothetical protein